MSQPAIYFETKTIQPLPDFLMGGYQANATMTSPNHYVNMGVTVWAASFGPDQISVAPEAGTLKNYICYVQTNASSGSADHVRPYINQSDGNGDISIAVATTGVFQDTTNTDTVAALDTLGWHFTEGTTASIKINTVGCEVT